MLVLICLIFSVLSTIDTYQDFATETLFWMVSFVSNLPIIYNRIKVPGSEKHNKLFLLGRPYVVAEQKHL